MRYTRYAVDNVHTYEEPSKFPTFVVSAYPRTNDANGIFRCLLKNDSDISLSAPGLWESKFHFNSGEDPKDLPSADVSLVMERVSNSDLLLAKCETKVAPSNVNYDVSFVLNYGDTASYVEFGYYSVNCKLSSI